VISKGEGRKPFSSSQSIVYVGHVIPTKGIRELVAACVQIEECRFDLNLIGPVQEAFRKELEADAIGIWHGKWIHFHGECARSVTLSLMRDADIIVLPTYTEGFPNVIVEAMALGKPIIASRVGAIPEMLTDELGERCGELVSPHDVEGLRQALVLLMTNRELARVIGLRAQKKATSSYSIAEIMEDYKLLWHEVASM
jgi:glycosyltransferase involved in cell wall biosynthesis